MKQFHTFTRKLEKQRRHKGEEAFYVLSTIWQVLVYCYQNVFRLRCSDKAKEMQPGLIIVFLLQNTQNVYGYKM